MDQLDFITHEELVDFFHRKKTEISCMEEPHIFLKQLRDHNLVPEDLYQEVIKRKSKKTIQDGVYKILDRVEKKGGVYVKEFWRCVSEDHIQQEYHVFRTLLRNLQDGSFRKHVKLPDAEKPLRNKDGEKEGKKQMQMEGTRKRGDEEIKKEEPGPSSGSSQKKAAKEQILSSLYKKKKIPVTCGGKKGKLYRGKLAKGEECILSRRQWFTPVEFERISGKESYKNWKLSIRYQGVPLQELIKAGRLKCPRKFKCSSR
ncbi:nuclear body protein SP140-like protein isoform X2 [Hemibagrus wyckioides]|uniref:nuclear body protein SP140-like protein isoform X2 n=1 Tax=Hemibagrus wyckioides TaxID=337641 RepID=UPI00266C6803|nr:nuclear body protein SP140-like protein isoform X2 [Hemibagrus wyckioides]